VRNPQMLAFARHYGVTVHTCEPADPASKGGSESTVKLAKADLVPKDTNLLAAYGSFAELEAACAAFCEQVNTRVHRVTRRAPADMLTEEQARLHRLPITAHTVAFGFDPHRRGQDPDGGLRGRPVLGAARPVGRAGVGPHPWCRCRRVGGHGACRRRWPGRGGSASAGRARLPAAAGHPFPARTRWSGPGTATTHASGGGVPRVGQRGPLVVDRGRRGGHRTDAGQVEGEASA
jgi:hypothetical protein